MKKRFLLITIIFISLFIFSGCKETEKKEPEKPNIVTVTFNENGGSDVSDLNVEAGKTITLPNISRDGYSFDGWYKGNNEFDPISAVNVDITLEARWTPNTYTIYFNGSDGLGSMSPIAVEYDQEVTLPANLFTCSGYKFGGWSTSRRGEVLYTDLQTFKYEYLDDLTIYAIWNQLYFLSFATNGARSGSLSGFYFDTGDVAKLPKCIFEKDGYTFSGWSLVKNGDVVYQDEDTITLDYSSDVVLYAKWVAIEVDYVGICKEKINKIKTVDINSFELIKDAIDYFNSIEYQYQANVSNITTLYEDIIEYLILAINDLDNTINQTKIDNINYLFNNLDTINKSYVTNYDKFLLKAFNFTYSECLASTDYEQIIVDVAYAYYYQATQIQYDQYNARRNLNINPEEACSYKNVYLDCSSFVQNVYNYAFGIELCETNSTEYFMKYAQQNKGKAKDVIYCVNTSDYSDASSKTTLLNQIKNDLKVGDLVVYRHGSTSGSSGHVMLYIGNDKFLHSTGSSIKVNAGQYDPTNFTDKQTNVEKNSGSIALLSLSEVFSNTESTRYLFRETASDSVYTFCVLRPLERDNLELTDNAKIRHALSTLAYEKSSSVNNYSNVMPKDEIEYKITITNKDTKVYKNLYIEVNVPDNMEYVSCTNGIYLENLNKIYFNVNSVSSKSSQTFTYTLKVKDNAKSGEIIIDDETYVCGIKLNKMINTVVLEDKSQTIKTSIVKYLDQSFNSALEMVNTIYNDFSGNSVFSSEVTEENVLKGLLSYYYITEESVYYKYMVPNMYGGVVVSGKDPKDNNRIRLVKSEYLETGDIIFTHTTYYKTEGFTCYLYVSNSLIMGLVDGKLTKVYQTETQVSDFLTTLVAYDRFAILRPSMVK